MELLLHAMKDQQNIVQHLNLANNFLDDQCYKILGDILKVRSKLTSINLANNEVSLIGARYIADGLRQNKGLQRLYLSHTSLQAAGATAIFEAITAQSSLSVLDVSHCNIGDDGAAAAGEMLKRNTSLSTLTIYANDIRRHGGKALFGALRQNSNIQKLFFGPGNQIGNSAMQNLADYLVWADCSLITLDISGSDISAVGIKILGDALSEQGALKELSIKANDLSNAGTAKKFFQKISLNKVLRYELILLHDSKVLNA